MNFSMTTSNQNFVTNLTSSTLGDRKLPVKILLKNWLKSLFYPTLGADLTIPPSSTNTLTLSVLKSMVTILPSGTMCTVRFASTPLMILLASSPERPMVCGNDSILSLRF